MVAKKIMTNGAIVTTLKTSFLWIKASVLIIKKYILDTAKKSITAASASAAKETPYFLFCNKATQRFIEKYKYMLVSYQISFYLEF